jgi:putative CocE/NonD family hydrolase
VYDKISVPAYIIAGWYDLHTAGTLSDYTRLDDETKKHSKLIVGPWIHEALLMQKVGGIDYGVRASGDAIDLIGIQLRWFDYWLRGIDNGIMREPPVYIFVMGDNVWRNENEWPLARTQYTNYYLRKDGKSASVGKEGCLSLEPPSNETPDVFNYDPLDPVPTCGGGIFSTVRDCGPLDQRSIEQRPDVLVFTTPTLTKDVEVTGPVSMKLYAASSAPDTDFTAKLVDVWPNGEAYILLDGIIRARYRNSEESPSFIKAGEVYEYTIDLAATSNVFKAGHRIRVEVSSSNFPRYDRNPNTGHPIGVDAETRVANQRIFHDSERPSHLILPVIPR